VITLFKSRSRRLLSFLLIFSFVVPSFDTSQRLHAENEHKKFVDSLISGAGFTLAAIMIGSLINFMHRRTAMPMHHGGPILSEDMGNGFTLISSEQTRFSDVLGQDHVKQELQQYIDFLKNPAHYTAVGAKRPKGIILHGPPGCGKTLFAKAIAGEAGCPVICTSGDSFNEKYIGVGAARVRLLFDTVKAISISTGKTVIVFIDEINAIGSRTASPEGGDSERNNTINSFLSQMDGFNKEDVNYLIIGATNFIEELDLAFLRPGRMDRKIYVPRPTRKGRIEILQHYLNKIKLDRRVSPEFVAGEIAARTTAFSAADLSNLVNEAAIIAGGKKAGSVTLEHINKAREKIALGNERKDFEQSKEQIYRTAIHEAGHALIGALFDIPIEGVEVSNRDKSLGVTQTSEKYETLSDYMRSELLHRIMFYYGGYAAEEEFIGETTPGVSEDLKVAGQVARQMVERFGMGVGSLEGISISAAGSAISEKYFFMAVKDLLRESLAKTKALVRKHKSLLIKIANALFKKGRLDKKEFYTIIGNKKGSEIVTRPSFLPQIA